MVGGDVVDCPVQQRLPEQLPVCDLSDGRAALVGGRPIGNLLGEQGQVVRARFDREPESVRFC